MAGSVSGPLSPERPLVFKFGGACFLDLADYRTVAGYIAGRLDGSRRIIAVVSAMSGTTGTLQNAQRELNADPPAELAASLMLTADSVSAVLLATALHELGVNARSIDAHDSGVMAKGQPDRANVVKIDPAPLWSVLVTSEVVVIPGGQALDENGRAVMLGRNSSDLSAVAAAVALNSELCEIFSDVPGVFTADPYLLPTARIIPELGYGAARLMTRAGAKVLHPHAVELAERHGLPILCRSRPPAAGHGTLISGSSAPVAIVADQRTDVWAFTHAADLEHVQARLAKEHDGDQVNEPVIVDYEGTRHLAIPGGDPHGTAHRVCANVPHRPHLRLITTVQGEHEPERHLVPAGELAAETQRRHLLHYPETNDHRGEKPRSSLSGMLTEPAKAAMIGGDLLIKGPSLEDRADGEGAGES
jgi:aspartate kinase